VDEASVDRGALPSDRVTNNSDKISSVKADRVIKGKSLGCSINADNDGSFSRWGSSNIFRSEVGNRNDLDRIAGSGLSCGGSSNSGGKSDSSIIRASVLLVDLKRSNDVSSNNLSDNNSRGLVDGSLWCQDVSRDFSVGNVDGSGSENVVNNSSGNGRERSSRKGNIISSSDVDGPRCLKVALINSGVSELSKLSRGQRDIVLSSSNIVTSEEKSTPVDLLDNIVGIGSQSSLVRLVASKSIIERSFEASSGGTRSSSSSGLKVERSSEVSSSEDILSVSSIRKSSSVWVDGSRSPSNISSGNK